MTIGDIQNILKEINYPGFSRDIVSFGMVKNISIKDTQIHISLHINSENENLLNQLKSEIKEKIIVKQANHNLFVANPDQELIFQKCTSFLNQFRGE